MGGLEINTKAQVIDTKGKPIPGLYAAGETTGGIHGSNRLGGNAIADVMTFGRDAGTQVAHEDIHKTDVHKNLMDSEKTEATSEKTAAPADTTKAASEPSAAKAPEATKPVEASKTEDASKAAEPAKAPEASKAETMKAPEPAKAPVAAAPSKPVEKPLPKDNLPEIST